MQCLMALMNKQPLAKPLLLHLIVIVAYSVILQQRGYLMAIYKPRDGQLAYDSETKYIYRVHVKVLPDLFLSVGAELILFDTMHSVGEESSHRPSRLTCSVSLEILYISHPSCTNCYKYRYTSIAQADVYIYMYVRVCVCMGGVLCVCVQYKFGINNTFIIIISLILTHMLILLLQLLNYYYFLLVSK